MARNKGLPAEVIERLEANQRASPSPRDFKDDARALLAQNEWRRMNGARRGSSPPPREADVAEMASRLGGAANRSIEALSAALLDAALAEGGAKLLTRTLEFTLSAGAVGGTAVELQHAKYDAMPLAAADDNGHSPAYLVLSKQIEVKSTSERQLGLHALPQEGGRCHYDRGYTFLSLGGFAAMPDTFYLRSCNDDRRTASSEVMWRLLSRVPLRVYLNFRSEAHVNAGQATMWLARDGWQRLDDVASTVSSGVPNGPYEGPVFGRSFGVGESEDLDTVLLYGSNTWEGTYFVFVQLLNTNVATASVEGSARESLGRVEGANGSADDTVEATTPCAAGEAEAVEGEEEEDDEGGEEEGEGERAKQNSGTWAAAAQLLRASRGEALGRCLADHGSGTGQARSSRPLRVVANAVYSAVTSAAVVDSMVNLGLDLADLVEAADAHVGAEIVSRWPAASRDVDVCLDVWRRLVHPGHGEQSSGAKSKRACRGHNQMSSWAKALCWVASAGFEGWDTCANSLLDEAESAGSLYSLLGALRHLSQFGPKDMTAPRWRLKQSCSSEQRVERLPVALRELLMRRYADTRDGTESGEEILEGILQGTMGVSTSVAGDGRARASRGSAAAGVQDGVAQGGGERAGGATLPWATLGFEPTWLATAAEITALHSHLLALSHANSHGGRGQGRLRVGIDTEWVDGDASDDEEVSAPASDQTHTDESPSETRAGGRRHDERRRRGAPPPAVAVVQLAIETHAWVIDALGDGRDALAKLLSWMLQNESLVLLGFAFAGDLIVLKPLCGEVDARNLVDLQTLARRAGEDTPSLQKVCARTIGRRLDKAQQCSDWARRPLLREQFLYAALDAHALLGVHDALVCGN